MEVIFGDLIYCSTYKEGYFILETFENKKWICYPSNKEERWNDVYEIMRNNGQISCLIEDKFYSEKHKTIVAKVYL